MALLVVFAVLVVLAVAALLTVSNVSQDKAPTARPEYRVAREGMQAISRYRLESRDGFLGVDLACISFIEQIQIARRAAASGEADRVRLLAFRREYRQIAHDQPVLGLEWSLAHSSHELQRLIVWLLGRCRNTRGIASVATLMNDKSRKVRCEVARALRRLNARAQLQQMAQGDPDPWIRGYAQLHGKREFAARMRQFMRADVDASRRIADDWRSPMPLVMKVSIRERHRPKSPSIIRRILEHIRLVLRGA